MNILITGGFGSIGSELTRTFSEDVQHKITVGTRHEDSVYKNRLNNNRVTSVVMDVADTSTYPRDRFDLVINAAAMKHVGFCEEHPLYSRKINCTAVQQLLEYYSSAAFVQISTDKVVRPVTVYGAQKAEAEQYVLNANQFVLRLPNVWKSNGSVYHTMKWYKQQKLSFPLYDKDMVRIFCALEDVSQAMFAVLQQIIDYRGIPWHLNVVPGTRKLIASILTQNKIKYHVTAERPRYERVIEHMHDDGENFWYCINASNSDRMSFEI